MGGLVLMGGEEIKLTQLDQIVYNYSVPKSQTHSPQSGPS